MNQKDNSPRAVIWDTDCGVDDFMGLIVLSNAMQHGVIDLKAVLVTPGNVKLAQGVTSLQLVLAAIGVETQIFVGTEEAGPDNAEALNLKFHGTDGLHGLRRKLTEKSGKKIGEAGEAVPYNGKKKPIPAFPEKEEEGKSETKWGPISDFSKLEALVKETGIVTWITTGPLTTTSRVWKEYPDIISHIDELISMGGAIDHPGNMNPTAEFNFFGDAKSVAHVLSQMSMTLFPLDITQHVDFNGILDDLVDLTKIKLSDRVKPLLEFIKELMQMHYEQHVLSFETILALHDVLPFVYLLCPELFSFRRLHGTIADDGSIKTDKRFLMKKDRPNMTVAMQCEPSQIRNFVRSCIVQLVGKLSIEDFKNRDKDGKIHRITSMNHIFQQDLEKSKLMKNSSSFGFLGSAGAKKI